MSTSGPDLVLKMDKYSMCIKGFLGEKHYILSGRKILYIVC